MDAFSYIFSSLGPQAAILMLDCRYVFWDDYVLIHSLITSSAERKKDQVCSPYEYNKVFKRLQELPESVEHLVVQLGMTSMLGDGCN